MNMEPAFPAIATCLSLVYFYIVIAHTGRLRVRHNIAEPASSGHPAFETATRLQQKTAHQLIVFLPGLWLYAMYVSSLWAGIIGFLWIITRMYFACRYIDEPKSYPVSDWISRAVLVWFLIGSLVSVTTTTLR